MKLARFDGARGGFEKSEAAGPRPPRSPSFVGFDVIVIVDVVPGGTENEHRCASFKPGVNLVATSIIPTSMAGHQGNSRDYLLRRLRLAGRADLVAAIEAKQVSAYGVAVALGWQKRRPTLGTGSSNASRRRAHRLRELGL
jgi:hypothetical protein